MAIYAAKDAIHVKMCYMCSTHTHAVYILYYYIISSTCIPRHLSLFFFFYCKKQIYYIMYQHASMID